MAQLDLLEAVVAELVSVDPAGLAGTVAAEVSRRVHGVVSRLEGQRLGCIGRVEVEGSWAVGTMHSFASWLATVEGLSDGLARRTVGAARALREHVPATAAAARAGTVTAEHVAIMVKAATTQTLRDALARPVAIDAPSSGALPVDAPPVDTSPDKPATPSAASGDAECTGEEFLLGHARAWRVGEFNRLVKGFTIASDPAAQEKAFKDACDREFLQISPTLGGMQISGFVTTEHGQLLTTALRAVAGVPAAGEICPADLRRVDALIDLAGMFLDGGIAGKGANVRPHLSVMVTWPEFLRLSEKATGNAAAGTTATCDAAAGDVAACTHAACDAVAGDVAARAGGASDADAGAARTAGAVTGRVSAVRPGWSPRDLEARLRAGYSTWEDGTGPIPDTVLQRIACDAEVTRIIFGPDSQILNIGQTRRTFTKEHRRAIVARDRTCVWPGCDAPPHVCEVHHAVRHWADGGETTPTNGALLCRHHHHRVDGENIAMTYANGWTVHTPNTYQPGELAA